MREADEGNVILADGFSCRTQIEQADAGGRHAVHLAELLRAGLHGDDGGPRPEQQWSDRPQPPGRVARYAATAGVGLLTVAGAAALGAAVVRRSRR